MSNMKRTQLGKNQVGGRVGEQTYMDLRGRRQVVGSVFSAPAVPPRGSPGAATNVTGRSPVRFSPASDSSDVTQTENAQRNSMLFNPEDGEERSEDADLPLLEPYAVQDVDELVRFGLDDRPGSVLPLVNDDDLPPPRDDDNPRRTDGRDPQATADAIQQDVDYMLQTLLPARYDRNPIPRTQLQHQYIRYHKKVLDSHRNHPYLSSILFDHFWLDRLVTFLIKRFFRDEANRDGISVLLGAHCEVLGKWPPLGPGRTVGPRTDDLGLGEVPKDFALFMRHVYQAKCLDPRCTLIADFVVECGLDAVGEFFRSPREHEQI